MRVNSTKVSSNELIDIAEKAAELVEGRKFISSEDFCDTVCVPRSTMDDLFQLLYQADLVHYGFDRQELYMDTPYN